MVGRTCHRCSRHARIIPRTTGKSICQRLPITAMPIATARVVLLQHRTGLHIRLTDTRLVRAMGCSLPLPLDRMTTHLLRITSTPEVVGPRLLAVLLHGHITYIDQHPRLRPRLATANTALRIPRAEVVAMIDDRIMLPCRTE